MAVQRMIGFAMTKNIYLDLVTFIRKFVRTYYQKSRLQMTIGKMENLIDSIRAVSGDTARNRTAIINFSFNSPAKRLPV
jgi:hypothetical protein